MLHEAPDDIMFCRMTGENLVKTDVSLTLLFITLRQPINANFVKNDATGIPKI